LNRPEAQASLAGAEPPAFYWPQLDGLRFVAALLVFLHHAPPLPLLAAIKPYGWVGVDLFLSISAFLITRLILLEHERTGSFSLRSFFIRRALRIWPLYLTFATFACLLGLFVLRLPLADVGAWWLSHLSFTNNVLTAVKGYSPVPFSSHLWTISLEEQAYMVMPLLLMAFAAGGFVRRHAILFCLGGVAVLMVARLALVLGGAEHPFIWVLPLRADSFLLGALAAILVRDRPVRSANLLLLCGALLMATVTLFPAIEVRGPYQVYGYTLIAAGCTLVVLSTQGRTILSPLLGCAPGRYLGKISYGVYVYHLVAIYAATRAVHMLGLQGPIVETAASLALTILVAGLSYRVLERPFLLLKERFAVVRSRPA
jgi:peptidoglycan/LPS O-acetylase OafA/YrhL